MFTLFGSDMEHMLEKTDISSVARKAVENLSEM